MKNLIAIIGSNYGDEGKGLMTDYFAAKNTKVLVVRYNGGAQAGHTVQLNKDPEVGSDFAQGRHVFNHFGSGTFANAATYLGPKFVVNPILFNRELKALGMKMAPKVYVSLNSPVTTPYDMLLNQWLEQSRGNARHGSCGLGIHETIVRNATCALEVSDLFGAEPVRQALNYIRDHYIPQRLEELNITFSPEIRQVLKSEEFAGKFMDECRDFRYLVQPIDPSNLFDEYETIIFEGAQGLLLDQDFGTFPYVTHSNTGLKNIIELIKLGQLDMGGEDYILNLCYVTRWYMTRHGNGPFPNETKAPHIKIIDATNIPNEWQGVLRFGTLDVNDLCARIVYDMTKYLPSYIPYKLGLAVTCLDQNDGRCQFIYDGTLRDQPSTGLLQTLNDKLVLDKLYDCYGSTREDVKELP
jgi:adenylosuccinate synthase